MREVLTTTADAAAKATQFVHRTSPLGGATFSQTLVFGFLGNPQASLEELAQTAATLGVPITPQALDQRFTPAAAACLEQVLRTAITRIIAADPVAIPLLERFTAVYVQDSSTIVLPDALAAVWQGGGWYHDVGDGRGPQVPGPAGVAYRQVRGATVARRSGLGSRRARAHHAARRGVV